MVVYADEKLKDSLRRLEKMDEEDILSMSNHALWRLALGFTHEELVRRIVAKGTDRYWKLQILEVLEKAYRVGYMALSNNHIYKYAQNGFTEVQPPYFNDIAYDIDTNYPLLPDEEENADEESPLPNPNSSPSGEAGRGLLEARIAELERENETLRQQIEELQSQPPTSEVQQASTNEAMVELFSRVMYGDERNAKAFIESAKGRSNVEITELVAQWVRENKISAHSCRRDLWKLLYAYKLYNGTESNFNTAMRKKQ